MTASEPVSQSVTLETLVAHLGKLPAKRALIAIAGAPASGKSTLANTMANMLNAKRKNRAAVIPMDGFHFDDRILKERGDLPRKGAPHTFDVGGLFHLLHRLKSNTETEVAIPVFDRSIELARAGAAMIAKDVELLLIEGNYLLLDKAPWDSLRPYFDLTVLIDVPETELRRRLAKRWQDFGFDAQEALAKLEENDLPNGREVLAHSHSPDYLLSTGGQALPTD